MTRATLCCIMAEQQQQASRLRRPGGRSAQTREAALSAVLDELVEVGYRNVTMERIAARSGVHKTTLYRRWGSSDALLAEAAGVAMDEQVPIPDLGTFDLDLQTLASSIAANLRRPVTQALIRLVAAEGNRNTQLQDASKAFWRHRGFLTSVLVGRAVARNEVPERTDPQALLEALIAPMYLQLLVLGGNVDSGTAMHAAETAACSARRGLFDTSGRHA
jgi:AcrR family transcriptional regulator